MAKLLFVVFILLLIFNKKFRRVFFTLTLIICVGTFILAKTNILYTDPETGRRFSDIEAENQTQVVEATTVNSTDTSSSSNSSEGLGSDEESINPIASIGAEAVKQQMQTIIDQSTTEKCNVDDYMGG